MEIVPYIVIGIGAGVLAGLFGVGGGTVIVPALVLGLQFSQITAVGTSLVALLAPAGLGGVYAFYQSGKIDVNNIKQGLIISAGMFLGSFFGARIALNFPDYVLKRAFCIFLLVLAARIWTTTVK